MGLTIQKAALLRSICRESFLDFFKEFWDVIIEEPLILNWHIEYLCNELQTVAERVFRKEPKAYDLVINVPPGSSKTVICSQMFNAWVWTRMPFAQFICTSYAASLALRDATRTRDIVQSDKYRSVFPDVTIREDTSAKGLFATSDKGSRFSTGVGGVLTGFHGHFLIVDDPLNPQEAQSEADLKTVNRWMNETLPSRKVDKRVTPIILIQQRLHQDDPSGNLLEKKKGSIKHICLPGELSDHEALVVSPPELRSRYQDGLLDPVRMPREVLREMEKDLGAYGYSSQVLQSPVPLGGGEFKVDMLNITDTAPRKLVRRARSWDKAGTQDGGAYSVGVDMAVDEQGRYWVLDVVRGQWDATTREMNIKNTAKLDGKLIPILIEVEGGSGGKESGQNTAKNLAGYRVILYHPTGDKVARAYGFASQVGAGNVYVLNRPWTKAYIEELRYFPNGKYKDQVDASSGAFNYIARRKKRIGGM